MNFLFGAPRAPRPPKRNRAADAQAYGVAIIMFAAAMVLLAVAARILLGG